MLDPQWVLNRLERGELILRLEIEKGMRFDYFPNHVRGELFSYTGPGRQNQAYGEVWFEIQQDRLQHFIVSASSTKASAEVGIEESVKRWSNPWDREEDHVVKIGRTHMRNPYDTVPLNNILVLQHLTLVQGLFYQAERTKRTKAENALVRDVSYKLNTVVAKANEGLYLGWF